MAGHVTQRTYNEDTPKERKVWRARYPDPDARPGTSTKIEHVFRTRREAQAWLTRQAAAVQEGSHVNPRRGDTPLRDVADAWRQTWNAKPLAPKTQAGYSSLLRNHVLPRFGDVKVAAVSAQAVQEWVNELAQTLHPEGVHHAYGVLRQVMRTAVRHKLIAVNPCSADSIVLPSKQAARANARPQLYLTAQELRELADAVPPHWRCATLVAGLCGLRAGELWALRRCDVDPLHSKLTVAHALKDIGGNLLAGPTKTHQRRTMTVPATLNKELEAHLALPPKRLRKIRAEGSHGFPCLVAGELGWTDDPQDPNRLLFTTPTGHPVRHTLFYGRTFRPVVRKLWADPHRLNRLRWHDLRHTCASLSLAATPNLHVVKERLGHSDIRLTINRYGHLLPSVDAALANALGAMWDETATATHPAGVVAMNPGGSGRH